MSDQLGLIFGTGAAVEAVQRARLLYLAERPTFLIDEYFPTRIYV